MKRILLLITLTLTIFISNAEAKGKRKKNKKGRSYSTSVSSRKDGGNTKYSNLTYHIGERGGCYYYNENGKKVYVDHSFCK
jgi:hypothetical protein